MLGVNSLQYIVYRVDLTLFILIKRHKDNTVRVQDACLILCSVICQVSRKSQNITYGNVAKSGLIQAEIIGKTLREIGQEGGSNIILMVLGQLPDVKPAEISHGIEEEISRRVYNAQV